MLAPECRRLSALSTSAVNQSGPRTEHVRLTFNVSVDNHVAVKVGNPLQNLPGVAPCHVFRQRSIRLQLVFDRALIATTTEIIRNYFDLNRLQKVRNYFKNKREDFI